MRNMDYRVDIDRGSLKDFEKIMLTSGQCKFFIPMGFMGSEKGETVCYDCSGYAPLEKFRIERIEDALYLLERTLVILEKSVDYYINPTRILLNLDTVFYSKDSGEVKMAYVPLEDEKRNIRMNIIKFIKMLSRDIKDDKDEYLKGIARYVCQNNYYIRDIIRKIELYKRQIYLNRKLN